ncbi:hypothetical protein DFH06DRAFT_1177365 [Mycena polygramma]|nr:hypothetical protein DFH06DRAFT_1177365 [Mycena polygramma]
MSAAAATVVCELALTAVEANRGNPRLLHVEASCIDARNREEYQDLGHTAVRAYIWISFCKCYPDTSRQQPCSRQSPKH